MAEKKFFDMDPDKRFADLGDRVRQFHSLQLPGQPMVMSAEPMTKNQIAETRATIETLRLVGYHYTARKMECLLEGAVKDKTRTALCERHGRSEVQYYVDKGCDLCAAEFRKASEDLHIEGTGVICADGKHVPLSDVFLDTGAAECNHFWHSNSGHGGEPAFRAKVKPYLNDVERLKFSPPIMHVKCSECSGHTWLTEQQWKDSSHTTAAYGGKKNWLIDQDSPEDMCDEPGCSHTANCTIHKMGMSVCNCGASAEPMTKAEIIYRREEAIRMRCGMIIFEEASVVTPEMWDRLRLLS